MSFADAIAVNSRFTRGIVARTWPALARSQDLKVVYPCIDTKERPEGGDRDAASLWKDLKFILSINRFERKKNIALAIKAFAALPHGARRGSRLVIAGKSSRPASGHGIRGS